MRKMITAVAARLFAACLPLVKAVYGMRIGEWPLTARLWEFYHTYLLRTSEKLLQAHGFRIWVDPADFGCGVGLQFLGERFERPQIRLLQRLLSAGMTAVDAGANVGFLSLFMARQVAPAGRVYAFEPNPLNHGLLQKNMRENGFTNVELVPMAVADREGTLPLFSYPSSRADRGRATLFAGKRGWDSIDIPVTSLDRYFSGKKVRIDLIKIDVEGAEEKVFDGMQGLIRDYEALKLIMEFEPVYLERSGSSPERFLDRIISSGFRIYGIEEDGLHHFGNGAAAVLFYRALKRGSNLFCTRQEPAADMLAPTAGNAN